MKKTIALLSVRCCLFIGATAALTLSFSLSELTRWWSILASVLNLLTIGILLLFCRRQKISYKQLIGYKSGQTKWTQLVAVVCVMLAVGLAGMYAAGYVCYGEFPYMAADMVQPIPLVLAIVNLLVLPLTTTLAEDGLYLGVGVNRLNKKWLAIVIPAFFYAVQHCFIPFMCDANYLLYRFLSFLPLTLLICYWYYKTRNPLPFMVGHFMLNIATVLQIILFSANPEWYELIVKMNL